MSMRILVFGMNGQLGWQCVKDLPGAIGVDRACLDAATPSIKDDLNQLLDRYQPDVVINAIAYTAVDRAEQERELAFRINADFPSQLAKLVAKALSLCGKRRYRTFERLRPKQTSR
ncbi:MAG: NAD-dependent epimerase/dehydratase family protein [Actinobacteria bacterium]|nr:NAD-dependent epimerase/dehydratase family protein [Actinomycetota bacterium]